MLTNAIDLHIHTAPDIVARSVTDIQAAEQAKQAHMRAIMLKNHLTPTYARATVASEVVTDILVFGGLVLNTSVGGINPHAVVAACSMGAKCIWMPTSSAPQHIKHFKSNQKPVFIFDESGNPVEGLIEVLEHIAKADCILATGHLTPEETLRLIPLAKNIGVQKIIVTHPEFESVAMSTEVQKKCVQLGAFIERCFYASNSSQKLPITAVAEEIKTVGWQSTILASDFGQDYNLPPVKGLTLFLTKLAECGITENNLHDMVTKHPAELLGLE